MKRIGLTALAALLAMGMLAGCGSPPSSAAPSAPASAPSASAPVSAAESAPASAPAQGAYNVEDLRDTLVTAANLGGTATFELRDLLGQSDIAEDDIVAMAGAQSSTYQEDGGIVVVVQAAPGQAETVKGQLEAFRDGILQGSANYATDYPNAYSNLQQARTLVHEDYVVLASSASGQDGGYEELDEALATLFS